MPVVQAHSSGSHKGETLPIRHNYPVPKLRLHLQEISHDGTALFLKHIKPESDFEEQVQNVLNLLYRPDSKRPGTRSVTMVLHPFQGVAYTTGIDLDDDHKEIHISLDYIKATESKGRHEYLGVICHELVHCFQWSGAAPGGLIEGIADYVRLNAQLGAAHWRRTADCAWDAGYERTAYFLDYLEKRFGSGTVVKINEHLREKKYHEDDLWPECCHGKTVKALWEDYRKSLEESHDGQEVSNPIPTHPARPL